MDNELKAKVENVGGAENTAGSGMVTLNENGVSHDEFLSMKKDLEMQRGIKVVEVAPNVYRTRIQE